MSTLVKVKAYFKVQGYTEDMCSFGYFWGTPFAFYFGELPQTFAKWVIRPISVGSHNQRYLDKGIADKPTATVLRQDGRKTIVFKSGIAVAYDLLAYARNKYTNKGELPIEYASVADIAIQVYVEGHLVAIIAGMGKEN